MSEQSAVISPVSPKQMAVYRATAQRREADRQRAVANRQEEAWKLAHQAAELLRNEFGAGDVALFGSLARGDYFHERSDVDLAVWDLAAKDYFRAVAELLDLSTTIAIDLVDMAHCSSSVRARIEAEGIIL